MAKKGILPKADYSMRNFTWVMRREIGIFALSCAFGLFVLPYWFKQARLQANNAQPNG